MLKAERVCYKLGNLLKAEVNLGKISESASKYGNIACKHAFGRPRKAAEFVKARRLFPALFDNFRRFKKTICYLCFCFVCYAVQSSSRQYKTLSPFPGGGGGV